MNDILYLLLRRLRAPLITLIVVYAISILGFTLIPGQDDAGHVWNMDFFHAFYFVSFMGSTIGFGEIPYAFTDAQRMWTVVTLYACVVAWLYAIGTTLAVFQDKSFARLLHLRGFIGEVRQIREPFYIVCGYGVTGSAVVTALAQRNIRTVVVDIDQARIDALELEGLLTDIPALCADAALPDSLDYAGLQNPYCVGVLALTNSDNVNLSISIASKVLKSERMCISRSENDVTSANLASFGTDMIVDPYQVYSDYLALAAHSPHRHLVVDWLLNPEHRPRTSVYQHRRGRWIICGYGRFGRKVARELEDDGTRMTIIDPNPDNIRGIESAVLGVGTEAHTLEQAGVADAVGIVAGTHNDADNLSIIMTARELNSELTTVVRQNLEANDLIFANSGCDFVMQPGKIVATQILAQLKTPLLSVFLHQLRLHDEMWAQGVMNQISRIVGDEALDSVCFTVGTTDTPAVCEMLDHGQPVTLLALMKSPHDRSKVQDSLCLLIKRGSDIDLLPDRLTELQQGDEVLFCGKRSALDQMVWTLTQYNTLYYVITGNDPWHNPLSRLFKRRRVKGEEHAE